jgi:HD-GYP domain-containing protein (c-di-GMP phosphodiesterase class II)
MFIFLQKPVEYFTLPSLSINSPKLFNIIITSRILETAALFHDIGKLGISDLILHHHEKFDGSGYPLGIRGEFIPLESRIIAVADTYDAMTSNRPYREGLSHEEAVEELIRLADIQFDRLVVAAFLKAEYRIKETTIDEYSYL